MKYFLALLCLTAASSFAVPLVYNNSAWYSGLDPYLVGQRENFMIQSVSVDAIKNSSGFTGEFQAILKFNFGGPAPTIGNISTISPYTFNSGGVVSEIHAADLFFKQAGTLRYGIPLVDHGGPGLINGKSVGAGLFDDGDLYEIAIGTQVLTSNQFLTNGTNNSLFGAGRSVWLTSVSPNPPALQTGTTQIAFNGLCTDNNNGCPQAEYTVTFNLNGSPVVGSAWYQFLVGIAAGTITPYFTGSACGNDLLDGAIPEPSTWMMLSAGLAFLVIRARQRRN